MTLYIHDQHLNQTNELSEILHLFIIDENWIMWRMQIKGENNMLWPWNKALKVKVLRALIHTFN